MQKESLKVGVNLGGWISQYKNFDYHHFDTFIVEEDIRKIADWGFDHVRLPVDYPVLEEDAHPGVYLDSGLAYLDNCLAWCQKYGLRMILDIHKAPGFSFTNTLEADATGINSLFTDDAMQQRFVNIWDALTRRYLGQAQDALAFDLLNEMVLPESSPWNKLAQKAIDQIRSVDQHRLIIIGGNYYNAVDELANIHVNPDPEMLYTFHFYDPIVVTHQKAPWVIEMDEFNRSLEFPCDVPDLESYIKTKYPVHIPRYIKSFGRRLDRDFLMSVLEPAIDFMKKNQTTLYCGEFGVIDRAPMTARVNWNRDFIQCLNELKIGYAYWSYKQMDFGLVDQDGKLVSQELLKAITPKKKIFPYKPSKDTG